MHLAFAIDTDDPAFAREPVSEADLAAWLEEAKAQVETGFAIMEQARTRTGEAVPPELEAALALRPEVEAALATLDAVPPGLVKTRLHGDYHLGQVIVAKGDIMILDFEGEPARSVDERRAKGSPLKDVAGMLRSFDYAAWVGVLRFAESDAGAVEHLLAPALAWRDLARQAFMDEYQAGIGFCPSWPVDPAAADSLLRLFVIQKLFYEVGYEAANRPGWLHIPLRGICDLFGAKSERQEIGGETSNG
jgi:maltose alpha-D-glucosyltransferase/alpha-amylase